MNRTKLALAAFTGFTLAVFAARAFISAYPDKSDYLLLVAALVSGGTLAYIVHRQKT